MTAGCHENFHALTDIYALACSSGRCCIMYIRGDVFAGHCPAAEKTKTFSSACR